jgi:HK97 family phage portal protein
MSVLKRLAGWLLDRRTYAPDDDYWYQPLGRATSSGIEVDDDSALTLGAVYACVKVLAETIGALPLFLYRRQGTGKTRALEHPLWTKLHDSPNGENTAMQWKSMVVAQMALYGNSYSFIERGLDGSVRAIWPMDATRMEVYRDPETREVVYSYRMSAQERRPFGADQILHPRLWAPDGLTGLSPIAQARESIGLGLASREFASAMYANGAVSTGVLKHPGRLHAETHKKLREDFAAKYTGIKNAYKPILLEEGMEWQQISLLPKDTQFIETSKATVADVARWYRIPPHMIGDLEHATFSNIEHLSLEFVKFTLTPWLVQLQQEIALKVLSEAERREYFVEFLVDGLMWGDFVSRMNGYAVGRQWGWLSVNDIRERENMNGIGPEGDIYLSPLNMIPAGKAEDVAPTDGTAA